MKDSAPAVYLSARASFSFAGWGGGGRQLESQEGFLSSVKYTLKT